MKEPVYYKNKEHEWVCGKFVRVTFWRRLKRFLKEVFEVR